MSPRSDKPLLTAATSTVLQEPIQFGLWDFAHPEFPTNRRYYNASRAAIPRKRVHRDSSHVFSKHERISPICSPENRTPEKIAPWSFRLDAMMTISSRRPFSDQHALSRQTATSSVISKTQEKKSIQPRRVGREPSSSAQLRFRRRIFAVRQAVIVVL